MTESVAGASPEAAAQEPAAAPAVMTVTPHFKLVFICVTVITVLTLLASLYIGIFVAKPTDAAKSAMDTCSTLANLGFGAMVGLLGGKAVQ
ncbi:hypothetical protein OG244_19110 [Streptomyces brevispora]|uniref:hypothetical protein n=1 Tax=Streptomyces brevispora TaxID=887462 RepID=UPI002E2F6CC8|nr:hypothetical protein [Streptomyces brevispora]